LGKMTIASKLLTNRRVRQAALELLKDPRADKKALATKLITNRRVREGAVELLKDSSVRAMLLQQDPNGSAAPRTPGSRYGFLVLAPVECV
jgi:hypothetical protein